MYKRQEKPVAVPQAGNRWARTSQVLQSLPWVTIECLDKDGKVLGIIEDEDDAELEAFDEDSGGSERIAKVLLEVMRASMKECRMLVDAQLRGNAEMISAMTEGMRATADVYRQALQVQQAHLMAPPGEEGGEMMKMMQMAMMLTAQNSKPKEPT